MMPQQAAPGKKCRGCGLYKPASQLDLCPFSEGRKRGKLGKIGGFRFLTTPLFLCSFQKSPATLIYAENRRETSNFRRLPNWHKSS